jgi:serine/threonine protein kinase
MLKDISRIGSGSYGTVFRATITKTNVIVVLKAIPLGSPEEGFPCTALREISLLKHLSHPNIVSLLSVYRNGRHMTLVFESCDTDLQIYMSRHKNGLSTGQIISFSFQLLLAVREIHSRSIIHRDIKPQNLLISDGDVLKLCDFGLGTVSNIPRKLATDVVTEWYRPPEICLRFHDYGVAADIWSVGCVIAEMAAGFPLFPCKQDHDLLLRMFGMFGIPTQATWPAAARSRTFPAEREVIPGMELRDILRECNPLIVNLLEKLLCLNPDHRWSADEALHHPLFVELQDLV